jgi:MFS family permease
MGFVPGLINTQLVAYIQDIGYSPILAATIMSVISAVSIAGGLGFGAVAVRLNAKHLAAGVLVLIILGFAILASMNSLGMIYLASVLLGFGLGASLPALPTLVGRCDALYRTQILAVGATMICVFQSSAATAAGAIHDATGQYVLAFVIAMVVCGLAIAGVYLIREDSNACEDQGVAEAVSARD